MRTGKIHIAIAALLAAATLAAMLGCNGRTDAADGMPATGTVATETTNTCLTSDSTESVEQPDTGHSATAGTRKPDVLVHVLKGNALRIETGGLSLTALGESVRQGGDYSVTSLMEEELPPFPQGMQNMTAAAAGYRLLPSGEHFSPAAELRVAYDPSLLPFGYTADDIYTSYYDEESRIWVRLERIGIDTARHEIVSLTTHFTDFVNELVKAPEMPETQAFVPTMMNDIEAANPLDRITLFQPPTANQEGTANLSYPIWTPAGRRGMQPNLALTYNSGGGNGWLGVGWDIGVPSVTLDTRWGVPRYSTDKETEIYLFSGEQLVTRDSNGNMEPLPHRTNRQLDRKTGNVRFYARTGDAHDSIIRHGTTPQNYWWEVVDRTGVTHFYGHYPDSTINSTKRSTLTDDHGNIARWMLCESRDPYGNWVRYLYDHVETGGPNPGKQLYLSGVSYTGHNNEEGAYRLEFVRRNRSLNDRPTNCILGFKEETGDRLCTIWIWSGDTAMAGYYFETECRYESSFKTRLKAVWKVDAIYDTSNVVDALKELCDDGDYTGLSCGITRHVFSYYDAPPMSDLFEPVQSSTLPNDNIEAFLLTSGFCADTVNRATAFGLSHNVGWSIGGTLAAGLGKKVWNTSYSVGGNYRRGKDAGESLLTLVDLDGDGLADKVFMKGGKMHWRRQILLPNGGITFGADSVVQGGAGGFLEESSTSNTLGAQASVYFVSDSLGLSGSVSWTKSTSTTSVYFSDMNGDGLVDIADNGRVLFNSVVGGQPKFTRYRPQQQGDTVADTPLTTVSDCGGIIFDGEVDDSVDCRLVWSLTAVTDILTRQEAFARCGTTYNGTEYTRHVAVACPGGYRVYSYSGVVDCSQSNLAMDGTPATEPVRVWIAPDSGTATISSYVRLIKDTSASRQQSRHADGVTYTIQHSRGVTRTGDTLHSTKDSILLSRHICGTCYREDGFDGSNYDTTIYNIAVKTGDILFFRLQSNDDSQYDNIEEYTKITLCGKVYKNSDGFVLSDNKYFQAPYDGRCTISGNFNTGSQNVMLHIEKPHRDSCSGSCTLLATDSIKKDSTIRFVVTPTNAGTTVDWSKVSLRVKIVFKSDSLPDSMTVWTPGEMYISHPANSIWGDTLYRCLFGSLHNGWGQFAYHRKNNSGNVILPHTLLPSLRASAVRVSDTAELNGEIHTIIDTADLGMSDMGDFAAEYGSLFCPINDSSCWVEVTADAEHGYWVPFGGQGYIGSETMSCSLQDGLYSTVDSVMSGSDMPPLHVVCYDDAVPMPYDSVPPKAIRKVNRSKNNSYSFGVSDFGASFSHGSSSLDADCLDLNGDRYPDIVGTHFVQYRTQWGGLGEKETLPPFVGDSSTSRTSSVGASFGASPISHEREIATAPSGAKFTLKNDGSAGGDFSEGWNHADASWTDINGDGLPDYVFGGGKVRINTGYDFLPVEDWNFDAMHSGQSITKSVNFGASRELNKFDIHQGSIQLGAGLGRSANRTDRTLMDINGDGLPDMVWRPLASINSWNGMLEPPDSVFVMLNLGNGRWSDTLKMNISNFNLSEGYNESLNVGATIGIPVFGIFKITAGLNGTPCSGSVSRDRMQLVDVDGDGLPDLVTSASEGTLNVRRNRGGRTNLLKTVTNSTGSRIHLDYALSVPCYEQPSRSWLLVQVATSDPLNPNGADTSVTRFAYSDPHYDRLERSFFGYASTLTSQIDHVTDTVCRTMRRDIYNRNILVRGRQKLELTCDGRGNKYIEKVYRYNFAPYSTGAVDTCSGNAYVSADTVLTRFYEGGSVPKLTTAEAYRYDRFHNICEYTDLGDTAYSDDGLRVEFTYCSGFPLNLVGLRSAYSIYSNGNPATLMRHTLFSYDTAKGSLKCQILDGGTFQSVYNMEYDNYGNLVRAVGPVNDSGQRIAVSCRYDSYTNSLPVMTADSYGDTSWTEYNLRFSKPVRVTAPSGKSVLYSYDYAGRLLSVKSPLAHDGTKTIVNTYYPIKYYRDTVHHGEYGFTSWPYAVAKHYDDDGNLVTETVVITDGFGRVIQSKKGITYGGQQKRQFSGRAFTDACGRVVRLYDPGIEDTSLHPGKFNAHFEPHSLTTNNYDVLDRTVRTLQPLGFETLTAYGVDNDATGRRRFTTAVTDPNGHTTVQYSDYDGRQVQVTDALGGITRMTYDAIGQLVQSRDPDGFATSYVYDMLGRLTQRDHPDAGTTHYTYDAAGNLTRETNHLGEITYVYTYQRMLEKRYSDIGENNVRYTYGTVGNGKGRIVRIDDGTGFRTLDYDALGNVTLELRTIALPGGSDVYMFHTGYVYDSWGRMRSIGYPDGETVTYTYAYGGDLQSMQGQKGGMPYSYIKNIGYNEFGQRDSIRYGNGTKTTYSYDELHRLTGLKSVSATGDMQKIIYDIDGVGNINRIDNTAGTTAGLGGTYRNDYTYDALNRLKTANGGMGPLGVFEITMVYSQAGRLSTKFQRAVSDVVNVNYRRVFGYCSGFQQHTPRRILDINSNMLHELAWDRVGNLAQVSTALRQDCIDSRFLFWTVDSRLHTVADGSNYSYYAYDHAGERTLKLTGTSTQIDINADNMLVISSLESPIIYPSPYVVLSEKGYTKHYYAGNERLCARIGGGGMPFVMQDAALTGKVLALYMQCKNLATERITEPFDPSCVYGLDIDDQNLRARIRGIPSRLVARISIDLSDFEHAMQDCAHGLDPEKEVYYYHGDHLGSASWITDSSGVPVQHLQYLPFGEPYINQRAAGSTYSERFTFTGKERDSETSFSYFGARYYDSDLSGLFLSVDPMADKYPNLSPYAYCAWNPVKLVDPDGSEINPVYDKYGNFVGNTKEGFIGAPIIIDDRRLKQCLNAEGVEIENLSCDVVAAYGRYFDDVESQLPGDVQSKIWTSIVKSYNGTDVGEFTFDISDIGGEIKYDFENKLKGNFAKTNNGEVLGRLVYPDRYETTVENVISTIVYHEWYGHFKMGYSGCNEKKSKNCDHYKCYEVVINSPIFKSTTEKYQKFYNETYNFFNQ